MQNLLLKILVLSGVIGGSCFVVWQAHDGLSKAAKNSAVEGFTPLSERPDLVKQAETEKEAAPASSWDQKIQLTSGEAPAKTTEAPADAPAFEPTLAEKPDSQSGTPADDSPFAGFAEYDQSSAQTAKMRTSGAGTQNDFPESGLTLPSVATANVETDLPEQQEELSPPTQEAEEKQIVQFWGEDTPTPAATPAAAPAEFAELPDQEVQSEKLASSEEPQNEGVLDAFAAATDTAQEAEVESDPFLALQAPAPAAAEMRFGPSTKSAPAALPELPSATPIDAAAKGNAEVADRDVLPTPAAPGRLQLGSSAIESSVVQAEANESSSTSIETVGGFEERQAPRPLATPEAAPLMPLEMPELPARGKSAAAAAPELPASGEADPFGASVAPAPLQVKADDVLPAASPAQTEGSTTFATMDFPSLPPQKTASPQPLPDQIQQVAEQVPATMPPLPPAEDVLPELPTPVPSSTSGSIPASTPANMDQDNLPSFPGTTPSGNAGLPEPVPLTPQPTRSSLPTLDLSSPPPAGSMATPELLNGTEQFDMNAPNGPQSPELKIEKIAPNSAEVGESVIYSIVIRNVGGSEAKDVVVEDRIPFGARLEGTIPQANLYEGKLTWQLGTIPPNEERKIQLKVTPTEAGQIGSVATVSFASSVAASIKVTSPKLEISMSGPQEGVVGEVLNFRYTLRNVGQSPAKSVFLRTVLPQGLEHPGGSDLEYESGAIAPGSEKVIDLAVRAATNGVYTVHSMVTNDGKMHAETRSDVNVIKSRLELTRTGAENRFAGRPATFQLKVTNTSNDVLRGITVQEKIPEGVEFPAIQGGGRYDTANRLLTWKISEIGPGQAAEINMIYSAKKAGEYAGTLVAVDDAGNRAELRTNLVVKGFADLAPDYTAETRTVLSGEPITLRLKLKNTGSESAKGVVAKFSIPQGVEFDSASGPVSYQVVGNELVFESLETIPAGQEELFHVSLRATQPGNAKITMSLETKDYSQPLFQDQVIRILGSGN
ncbi:hypothetical protein SH668x_003754 [Planctomicrobium sp. SH668]|uniref:hypothetical protein n=1 Tax=Planctomicrobium sp. SH668 TaxID=3448126 RepID=UPI003F5B84F6